MLLGIIIIRSREYQYLFLLLASYFFYYYSSGSLFVLVIYITLLNYFCARALASVENQKIRKIYFIVGIIGSLSTLALFKYTDFAIKTVNALGSWLGYSANLSLLHLILPIGISFYTFQAISYLIEVYKKKLEPEKSLLDFALYMTFFPHLLAGPIVRAADFLPQLKKDIITITSDNFRRGLTLILWGLVKKVVIADNVAQFVVVFFDDPTKFPGSLPVILGAVAFAIQVYCDFSGYTDIAIGLARIMGIHFPMNFDKPFFSKSLAEFWKRWHISLSTWFRDYIFQPIVTSGERFTVRRLYFAVMVVYVISGLWHGAGWTFIIWGALHGFFLVVGMMTENIRRKFTNFIGLTKVPKIHAFVKTMITLYLILFPLLVFRLYHTQNILSTARKFLIIDFSNFAEQWHSVFPVFQIPLFFFLMFIIVHTITYFKKDFLEKLEEKGVFEWTMYLTGMIVLLYFFAPSQSMPYVYFQF